MASFLSIPPPQALLHRRSSHSLLIKPPLKCTLNCSSPLQTQNSTTIISEEDSSPPPPSYEVSSAAESSVESTEKVQLRGCKTCGREEIENGCNGEGRIQGGIATVPGFGWWPIKAYRPCPGFVASGGRYRRRGQSMDEVASGRGRREASLQSTAKERKVQGD